MSDFRHFVDYYFIDNLDHINKFMDRLNYAMLMIWLFFAIFEIQNLESQLYSCKAQSL
jgi:hypothetical protein